MMIRTAMLLVCLSACFSTLAVGENSALLLGDTTCVPVRCVADWLGATIRYTTSDHAFLISKGDTQLLVRTGSNAAQLNGNSYQITPAVFERDATMYLPARSLAKAFQLTLAYDNAMQQISIKSANNPQQLILSCRLLNVTDGEEMVWVPAGEFVMGSCGVETIIPRGNRIRMTFDNAASCMNESPAHQVYLSGYWLGRYEVTRGQYARYCHATGHTMPQANTVAEAGEQYPIAGISWTAVQAYARWAGGRLPSEAEWEKGARGTDGRFFPWGNWRNGQKTIENLYAVQIPSLLPVGTYPMGVSPYGAYDMVGNVREWCADWYQTSYYQQSPRQNPTGPDAGQLRAVRGCSNYQIAEIYDELVRCTVRDGVAPGLGVRDIGFRIVIPVRVSTRATEQRAAVVVKQLDDAATLLTRGFSTGYQCIAAWVADLNADGAAEAVALATEVSGTQLPPMIKIFPWPGVLQAMSSNAGNAYVFDEKTDDGWRWHDVAGDVIAGELLAPGQFSVRDINADGVPEICVTLRSYGLESHDEAMFLLHWDAGQLRVISTIPLPDATRGAWLIDDATRARTGMEIVTVGRQVDEDTARYLPQPYLFTYYAWNGTTYASYRSRTTSRLYEDAAQAITCVEW